MSGNEKNVGREENASRATKCNRWDGNAERKAHDKTEGGTDLTAMRTEQERLASGAQRDAMPA